ncbi:unnamed protein product [Cylicocyclus nassatus]|uniref:Uncharacterized protein n=1 Tax=Cylicocyclus nassatus TaxID=53992 RepID=A0AA36GE10_CYLNA|nr:unnamed protein product [Cylicocyclus nassatus]
MRLLLFVTVLLMLAIMTMDVEARRQRHISNRLYRELLEIARDLSIELTPAQKHNIWRNGRSRKLAQA